MVYGKVPPQAKELEERVLGACLIAPEVYQLVADIIQPECLYVDAHQRIFSAMQRLASAGKPVDMPMVGEALKASGELEMVGGLYALVQLTNEVRSVANVEAHTRIIMQKFLQRELIRVAGEVLTEAYNDQEDVFDLLADTETKVMQLSGRLHTRSYQHISTLSVQTMNRIDELRNRNTKLTGVPTGYPELDDLTNGWQARDLVILAARPSIGKTAFALNLLRHAAQDKQKPTPAALFSLEMSASQLTPRILSASSHISLKSITNGSISDGGIDHITKMVLPGLFTAPIFIDDSPALTIQELSAKARKLVSKEKVGLIIVDYLQLMDGHAGGKGNREQEISKISRGLKKLAAELNITVIALSQLSRDVEKRKGKPQLSDLRESGAIEQDADMVIFLYRPTEEDILRDARLRNTGEALVRKHRNGELAEIQFSVYNEIQSWMTPADGLDYEATKSGFIPVSKTDFSPSRSLEDRAEDLPF